MLFVGVDLAERHSAAVMLNENLEVLFETTIDTGPTQKQEHPWNRMNTYAEWSWELMNQAAKHDLGPYIHFVIEEPYPHAVNVAPAYRMQGAVLMTLRSRGMVEQRVRITKSKPWQDYFGYTKKEFGNSKAWAQLMCEEFGYVPGQTWENPKTNAKKREDLRDAYLLARWLKETQ